MFKVLELGLQAVECALESDLTTVLANVNSILYANFS